MTEARSFLPYSWRLGVIAVATVAALAFINLQILAKERIVDQGTTMLLELAPVDPRSLMQGDFMSLRYALSREVAQATKKFDSLDGDVVVTLDQNGVAQFARIYQGARLARGERLLAFRKRGERVRLASDAWFFEEGTASTYRDARYGELRVAADGESMLVGLRDASLSALSPAGE